jgi:zinc protease
MTKKILALAVTAVLTTSSLFGQTSPSFKIDYEKFTLPNGLDVIFHIDRSDPVVAVNLTAHVGSAREKAGRTGFAHMFEHLLFLESENLGKGRVGPAERTHRRFGSERLDQPRPHELSADRA